MRGPILSYGKEAPKGVLSPRAAHPPHKLELPTWAPTGWEICAIEEQSASATDPYVIYDRWGILLYQWPDEYVPSPVEVIGVCDELMRKR